MNGGEYEAVQENDEPKQDLMPESETDFFSTMAADGYSFEINGEGKVTAMILRADGQDIAYQRIQQCAATKLIPRQLKSSFRADLPCCRPSRRPSSWATATFPKPTEGLLFPRPFVN
jgi:hypothetical protein